MTRVLVTGANGFLGGAVVRRLRADGHAVTNHAYRGEGEGGALRGDLADAEVAAKLLAPWRWDAVVNLAGPVTSGTEDLATGMRVVTEHANIALNVSVHARSARVIHASSMTVYGRPTRVDVDEKHPRSPLHLYGLAKRVAEDVLLADPVLDRWVLRFPGLFSEERRNGALYHFCRAARAGVALQVHATEPTSWNVLHVADAAEAIALAVSAPEHAGGAINISYDEPVELVSVARLIADYAGTGAVVENPSGIEHPPFRLVAMKAKEKLAWSPPSLRDRITRLYEAYAAS